jgi:hypothetical protein
LSKITGVPPHDPIGNFFKLIGIYIFHFLAAILGTTLLESSLWQLFGRSHSTHEVLIREWVLGVIVAGSISFYLNRRWPHKAALWIWVIPIIFLSWRILALSVHPGQVFAHLVYPDCLNHRDWCRDFFTFTVPAIRTTIYSLVALVVFKLRLRAQEGSLLQLKPFNPF